MERVRSERAYANPWLTIREDTLRRPDGSTHTYAVIDAADIVLVVPYENDRLHLVEQYRHPLEARCWEFPSGSVDADLDPEPRAAAARELREETGLRAGHLTQLGTVAITPSTMSQRCAVFLATDLAEGVVQRDATEVDMRSAWFSVDEVADMIRTGALTDAKSLAAYALLTTRIQASPQQPSHRLQGLAVPVDPLP